MKKIAIALALSLAATSAFAQSAVKGDITNLAPAGTVGVEGATLTIVGVGTGVWTVVAGVLLLILVGSAGSNSTT